MKKTALFTALLCLTPGSLFADVPLFINYQGKVYDSAGLPLGATGSASAPVAAPAPITITVQPGLTLWAIARRVYGRGALYPRIFEANRELIRSPGRIFPGQVLLLPRAD